MIDSIMDIMENNISSIPLAMEPVKRTNQYHEQIYAALKDRDVQKAQDLMLRHIQEIHDALEALSKKNLPGGTGRKNKKS
jgi:DNA-binding GntR family transcriptional regulator